MPGININTIRTRVRHLLGDAAEENQRFSDESLNNHIHSAAEAFSRHVPLEAYAELETQPETCEINISSLEGLVAVKAVFYPVDSCPGVQRPFSVWGNTLKLTLEEMKGGEMVGICYVKSHHIDEQGSSLPEQHEGLVAEGAAGLAALEEAARAANRINTGGSSTSGDYRRWANERLAAFEQAIKALGRQRTVQFGWLYRV